MIPMGLKCILTFMALSRNLWIMSIKITPPHKSMKTLFRNITNTELPALLRANYDLNEGDMEKTAHDLETMDMMLGVLKMKSLVNSRERNAKSRWTRGRNLQAIFERLIF